MTHTGIRAPLAQLDVGRSTLGVGRSPQAPAARPALSPETARALDRFGLRGLYNMQEWKVAMAGLIDATERLCDASPFDQLAYDETCAAMAALREVRGAIEQREKSRPSPSFADTALASEPLAASTTPPKTTTGKTDPFCNAL